VEDSAIQYVSLVEKKRDVNCREGTSWGKYRLRPCQSTQFGRPLRASSAFVHAAIEFRFREQGTDEQDHPRDR